MQIKPNTYTQEQLARFTSEDWDRLQKGLSLLEGSPPTPQTTPLEAPGSPTIDDPTQAHTLLSARRELASLEPPPEGSQADVYLTDLAEKQATTARDRQMGGTRPRMGGPGWVAGGLHTLLPSLKGAKETIGKYLQGFLPNQAFNAVIHTESHGDPEAYNPVSGARGMGQLIAKWHPGVKDYFDPVENLTVSKEFWERLRKKYEGDLDATAGAYFTGEVGVDALRKVLGPDWLSTSAPDNQYIQFGRKQKSLHQVQVEIKGYLYKVQKNRGAMDYLQKYGIQ